MPESIAKIRGSIHLILLFSIFSYFHTIDSPLMPFLQHHVIFILNHFYFVKDLTVSFDLHQPPTFAWLLTDSL